MSSFCKQDLGYTAWPSLQAFTHFLMVPPPPRLGGLVSVDHSLMVSSHLWNGHSPHDTHIPPQPVPHEPPTYEDTFAFMDYQKYFREHPSPRPAKYSNEAISPSVKSLLPKFIMGKQFHEQMNQGDFVLNVQEVRKGVFRMQRVLPPGTSKS